MPIAVACQCGQRFQAKDELAGKTVRCPKCAQPLRIPAPQSAPRQSPQMPASPPAAFGGRSAGGGSLDDLFDEVGIEASASGLRCTQCGAPMPAGGFLCVQCGFNHQTGERIGGLGVEGPSGYRTESLGNPDLDRAAAMLDKQTKEFRSSGDPIPWWVYLIALGFVCSFVAAMVVLTPKIDLTGEDGGSGGGGGGIGPGVVIAFGLYAVGSLLSLAGGVWMIIIAFRESWVQGLLILVVPCYALYFAITRWDECGTPFMMSVGGNVLSTVAGFVMSAMAPSGEYGLLPPAERPAYVAPLNPGSATA